MKVSTQPPKSMGVITPREKENHLQNAIFAGYVSFLEGIYNLHLSV